MDGNLIPVLPAAQVLLTALVVMLLDLFLKDQEKGFLAWISLLGLALCGGETVILWGSQDAAFGNAIMLDNFALFFTQIFLGVAALTILSSIHYIREMKIHEGEFYALVLFATAGMILMAAANDLIVFFLGLETMSIAVYVLTGIWREPNVCWRRPSLQESQKKAGRRWATFFGRLSLNIATRLGRWTRIGAPWTSATLAQYASSPMSSRPALPRR